MAKYVLTNKAVEDLSKIWDYTYLENQAEKYYVLLISAFGEIAENSAIGKINEMISNHILGFKVGKHLVFYKMLALKEVLIVRVLHTKMDVKIRIQQ